jgi:LEA14-like dessication related protein
MSNTARVATLAAALAVMTGCASLERAEPPEVTLVDLRVGEVTVFETALDATVRISNPNPDPLELEGASFKLRIDGHKVGSGTVPEPVTVPRLGSVTVDAGFHLSNLAALRRLQEILESGTVAYALEGKLFVRRSWGRSTLRFDSGGRVDLDDAQDEAESPAPVTGPRS